MTGVRIASDVDAALARADVLIDFTRPAGTLAHLAACARAHVGAVVGTTGLDAAQRAALAAHARQVPVVFAANMSVGVNVLLSLVEQAARALGPGFDIEIVEMHHHHKVDAPSGTALRLGEAAAAGARRPLAEHAVYAREGHTGERKPGTIGFATLRGGDVVGEHMVVFAGEGERVELAHRATSRQLFASGALRAVRFVAAKRAAGEAGLFDMPDVLGPRAEADGRCRPFALGGRLALVTGGGSGLGLAIAEGLAAAGARVVVNGRNAAKLDAAIERLAEAGHAASACAFDVSDEAAVARRHRGHRGQPGRHRHPGQQRGDEPAQAAAPSSPSTSGGRCRPPTRTARSWSRARCCRACRRAGAARSSTSARSPPTSGARTSCRMP